MPPRWRASATLHPDWMISTSMDSGASCPDAEMSHRLVRHFAEHRQSRRLDDRFQALARMKLHVVAVDDDGVFVLRREASKLGVNQLEAPHHVFRALVR